MYKFFPYHINMCGLPLVTQEAHKNYYKIQCFYKENYLNKNKISGTQERKKNTQKSFFILISFDFIKHNIDI